MQTHFSLAHVKYTIIGNCIFIFFAASVVAIVVVVFVVAVVVFVVAVVVAMVVCVFMQQQLDSKIEPNFHLIGRLHRKYY